MHIDARIEAQNDVDVPCRVSRHAFEEGHLKVVVDGNKTHTGGHRFLELGAALVIAVKNHLRRSNAGAHPDVDLTA